MISVVKLYTKITYQKIAYKDQFYEYWSFGRAIKLC